MIIRECFSRVEDDHMYVNNRLSTKAYSNFNFLNVPQNEKKKS